MRIGVKVWLDYVQSSFNPADGLTREKFRDCVLRYKIQLLPDCLTAIPPWLHAKNAVSAWASELPGITPFHHYYRCVYITNICIVITLPPCAALNNKRNNFAVWVIMNYLIFAPE